MSARDKFAAKTSLAVSSMVYPVRPDIVDRHQIQLSPAAQNANQPQTPLRFRNSDWFYLIHIPLHRLELCSSAPEADALSTELQGRARRFYHRVSTSLQDQYQLVLY